MEHAFFGRRIMAAPKRTRIDIWAAAWPSMEPAGAGLAGRPEQPPRSAPSQPAPGDLWWRRFRRIPGGLLIGWFEALLWLLRGRKRPRHAEIGRASCRERV